MYCNKCKKNMNDDFKHCPYCGEKLKELENVTVPPKRSSNPDDETVTLFLSDRKLTFSKKCIEYNNFRNLFCEKGEKLEDEYIEYYNSSKHTFESVFEEQIPAVMKKIDEAIEFGISVLSEYGINSISGEEIARYITEYIEADFKYIGNKVNAILSADNESIETREKFAQYNQYWSSGGFGIKDAIKGVIQSEVLNIGTNLLQNAIGGVVRAIDKIAIKQMQKDFGENKDVFYHLHNPIYLATLHTGNFVYEQLKEKNLIVDYKTVIDDEYAWLENRGKLKQCLETYFSTPYTINLYVETIDTICECLTKDVNMPEAYLGLYKILKEEHEDIEKIARCFGEGRNYKRNIIEYDLERIKELKDMPEDTLTQINLKINKIKLIIKNNHYIDTSSYLDSLCKKRDALLQEEDEKEKIRKCLNDVTQSVTDLRYPVDEAIKIKDYEKIWAEANKGNAYAEFMLEKYYLDLCQTEINVFNYANMTSKIEHIKEKAMKGNLLANYLWHFLMYMLNNRSGREPMSYDEAQNVIALSAKGITSAIFQKGIWGLNERVENIIIDNYEGITLLEKAAKKHYPPAVIELSKIYRDGKFGITKDLKKAEYYLSLCTSLGVDTSAKWYDRSKNGEKSGCFITSAVCNSFGKPDDCYELTLFRNFRDGWLSKQIDGELLIREYYDVAPKIVKKIETLSNSVQIYKYIWDNYLDKCLHFIEEQKFDFCKKTYCKMVSDLKNTYYIKGEI